MASLEGIKLRINKFLRKKFSNFRKCKLINKSFTVISNNCWGGMIYESYNMEKLSPTIGLFIMPDDYIKFISNLKYYLNCKLNFINPKDSKYFEKLKASNNFGKYPVGKLDDIEIMFMHYKNINEVNEKWTRRIKRINYSNIIYKFNDQNGCSKVNVKDFIELPLKNKIFFTVKNWNLDFKGTKIVKVNQIFNKEYINTSSEPFGKIITKYLNNIKKNDN